MILVITIWTMFNYQRIANRGLKSDPFLAGIPENSELQTTWVCAAPVN